MAGVPEASAAHVSERLPARHSTAEEARRARRARSDAGMAGGVEALPFGLLVFVVGALLTLNAWAVVDAKFAVDAAARQATRSYVEAEVGGARAGDAGSTRGAGGGQSEATAEEARDTPESTVTAESPVRQRIRPATRGGGTCAP